MAPNHACKVIYGVIPEGPIWDKFKEKLDNEMDIQSDQDIDGELSEYDRYEAALEKLKETNQDHWIELQEQYDAQQINNIDLYYTGSGDDRAYGHTGIEPGQYVLGLCTKHIELVLNDNTKLSERFMREAEWHEWVTSV